MYRKIFSILILTLLLAACAGSGLATPTVEPATAEVDLNTITAEGTLLPERSVELAFAQGGVVKQILVQEGDHVAKGDVILRLVGIESVQAELTAAKLELILAQQALDSIHRHALSTSLKAGQVLLTAQKVYESEANGWDRGNEDEATDLDLRIDDYVTTEADYRNARAELDDVLNLDIDDHKRRNAQKDFESEEESLAQAYTDLKTALAENTKTLDEKTIALLSAISDLETAREMQSRLDGSNLDPETLAAAEAGLAAASAHVTAAEAALEFYELRAPFGGTLLRLDLSVGEIALPMTPIAFVADLSHWIIETRDLAEVDVADVAVGDSASIMLDAFTDEVFTGTVIGIDSVGKLFLGDMTFQVTITLDEADPRFLWNMTAVVTVNTDGE